MPISLDKFYWDDLARAGDKVPHSEDDKECGDHFIAIDRDCHDGKANRPEQGENPYWTGPNSAEERRKRGVPLDETKPSIPPEELPPEELPPEELPPEEIPKPEVPELDEYVRRKAQEELMQAPENVQLALFEAARGVFERTQTAVDRAFDAHLQGPVSGDEIYDAFAETRDMLREKFGSAVTLFRLQPEARIKDKHTLNWVQSEKALGMFEKMFEEYGEDRTLESREVPIEDIAALNVGKRGRYEEFIVLNHESEGLKLPANYGMKAPPPPVERPREVQPLNRENFEASKDRMYQAAMNLEKMSFAALMFLQGQPDVEKMREAQRLNNRTSHLRPDLDQTRNQGDLAPHFAEMKDLFASFDTELFSSPKFKNMFPDSDFELQMAEIGNSLARYEAETKEADPRDIIAWDTLARKPESMENFMQIPDLQLKGIGPEGPKNEAEEKWMGHQIKNMNTAFWVWQASPSVNGTFLAGKLLGTPSRMGLFIDESSWQPNPQAARIILERSARAGDERASEMLYEEFGESEAWTPGSWIHDSEKAAQAGLAMLADLGVKAARKDFKKQERAIKKLEKADVSSQNSYNIKRSLWDTKANELEYLRDEGRITQQEYDHRFVPIGEAMDNLMGSRMASRRKVEAAKYQLTRAADGHRRNLLESLTKANEGTRAPDEVISQLTENAGRQEWAPIDEHDDDYRTGVDRRGEKIAGQRLLELRQNARQQADPARYEFGKSISHALGQLLGMTNSKLLEGPLAGELFQVSWQTELYERAHANEDFNSIVLDSKEGASVAMHEFAHHLEFRNPNLHRRMLEFYDRRTRSAKVQNRRGYKKTEWFKEDKFFDKYCGKWYVPHDRSDPSTGRRPTALDPEESRGKVGASTELVSMGVQALFDAQMFREIVTKDPEHLALIVAALRGS